MKEICAIQNQAVEWSYVSGKAYKDPFNEIELDVLVALPDGNQQRVPAFWAGDQEWRVRYAPPMSGKYLYRTVCSDEANRELHSQEGTLLATPYEGANPLLKHGPLRVSDNGRFLQHADGTPFFWLGDTWWHGLTKRFGWPEDVRALTADRVSKGFTVIQIVAGLLPELTPERFWQEWSANEGGWAWEEDFARINPRFFDAADCRISHLVQSGLVPCVVGAWGYYLQFAGVRNLKKHWRYLVARYGAYPVVWCLAGEMTMPVYGSERAEQDRKELGVGWAEVGRYLKEVDPYAHPRTAHCNSFSSDSRAILGKEGLLDIDLLQAGHTYQTIERAVRFARDQVAQAPRYPVLIGEACYEGEYGSNWQDVQRLLFWTSMLSGSCGHTYGANNIWQINSREQFFVGIRTYGDLPWDEAMSLPGSKHLGVSKRLLERYPWWRFEPCHIPNWDESERISPFMAGIPGQVWLIYLAGEAFDPKFWGLMGQKVRVEDDVTYRAFFFDPRDGRELDLGQVELDQTGQWAIPQKPTREDMVLVLEKRG